MKKLSSLLRKMEASTTFLIIVFNQKVAALDQVSNNESMAWSMRLSAVFFFFFFFFYLFRWPSLFVRRVILANIWVICDWFGISIVYKKRDTLVYSFQTTTRMFLPNTYSIEFYPDLAINTFIIHFRENEEFFPNRGINFRNVCIM